MPARLNGDVPWGVTLGRYWHGPEKFGERQRYSGERNLLLFGPNGSGKVSWMSVNLPGDESQHVFGRSLVDAHDPTRMAKVCELNREPNPIGGAPPLANQR
jgi:hypothetical protein